MRSLSSAPRAATSTMCRGLASGPRENQAANRVLETVGLAVFQLEVEPARVQEVVETHPQLDNEWRQFREVHEIGCKRHPVGQGPSHEQTGGAPRDVAALEVGHPLV